MLPKPETLYGEVKLDAERALAHLSGPGFATASLRATGVYGNLLPNKWTSLIDDYLRGGPVPVRAGTEVHGRDLGRAVRLMLETESARISGEAFNVSDIVTDTRDILSVVQQETGCPSYLPAAAHKAAVNRMRTERLEALGWLPGGEALFKRTIRQLASAIQRR
jgi:nucleoside-diphosphate-sugar epimerase